MVSQRSAPHRSIVVIPLEDGRDLGRRFVQTGRERSCVPPAPVLEQAERSPPVLLVLVLQSEPCSAGRVLAVRGV